MNFSDFVSFYWNKLRRSGRLWTAPDIVTDSGLGAQVVDVYLVWCKDNGSGLTDQQLIDKFNNGYFLSDSIFTPIILAKAGNSTGPATLSSFITDLKALIDHYTR